MVAVKMGRIKICCKGQMLSVVVRRCCFQSRSEVGDEKKIREAVDLSELYIP
jgi:hypothetical protein